MSPGGDAPCTSSGNDPDYRPIASACEPYPIYSQDPPAQALFLADAQNLTAKTQRVFGSGTDNHFPHYTAKEEPALCKN
jgi:hypothetical protein